MKALAPRSLCLHRILVLALSPSPAAMQVLMQEQVALPVHPLCPVKCSTSVCVKVIVRNHTVFFASSD